MEQQTQNHQSADSENAAGTHIVVDHSSDTSSQPKNSRRLKEPGSSEGMKSLVTTLALFACAIIVALFLTSFVFQQYEVDGPSMESTLQNQDRLIVIKIARSWSDLTGHPYIPERGNIVIFNESGLYSSTGVAEKQLVKRVVALPGERVVVSDGRLTVYNQQHPNGFDPDTTLPYGKVIPITSGNINLVVPKGDVYVMGDNRPDS